MPLQYSCWQFALAYPLLNLSRYACELQAQVHVGRLDGACVFTSLYIGTTRAQVLYNEDMLEEEAVTSWYKSTDGMTKEMQAQRKKASGENLWLSPLF